MESYSARSFETGFFHSTRCSQGLSTLWCVSAINSLLSVNNTPLCGLSCFLYPLVRRWTFGLLPFGGPFMNDVTRSLFLYRVLCGCLLSTPLGRGIARSLGNSMFSLSGTCDGVFQRGCSVFHPHQQRTRVPVPPRPCKHLSFSVFLIWPSPWGRSGISLWF